ncbi:MAG TPA: hypothetical protein VM074_07215 [Solimonas sp.]|nr:hypothetical protein [Solimonas sp.]
MNAVLRSLGCAALLAAPVLWADDIELYTNPIANPSKPPMTVLMVDLNFNATDIICNNVLLSAECDTLRQQLTLAQLFEFLGADGNAVRTTVKTLSLGVVDTNTLLNVNVNALTASVKTLLSTALGTLVQISNLDVYRPTLRAIVRSLANVRLAVMVSHQSKGTATTSGGQSYACNFSDLASIPGDRAQTLACSNGGYVLLGFIDLLNDPLQQNLNTVLNRLDTLAVNGMGDGSHPYQGKELYYELSQYLKGDKIYNGHLGYFDYGDTNAATNLNQQSAALSWDPAIENGASYKSALDQFGVCDTINVLNVMLSNSQLESDSDKALALRFPGADADRNGQTSFAELVTAARDTGFTHRSSPVKLNSYFLVNGTTTAPLVGLLQNAGTTVLAAPNILGLFGLGRTVAESLQPVLIVNASLLTPSLTVDLASPNRTLEDAFFGYFKPAPQQKPVWAGNLKKLALRESGGVSRFYDANGSDAIADDGRIKDSALTFWTDTTRLGGRSGDGREATLGGAGQAIPGFSSGAPGRANSETGKRKLYYDKYSPGAALAALDADDTNVKAELKTPLGAANNIEAQELLLYARGYDVGTTAANKGVGASLVARSWIHGAVLHSRPVAINYGGTVPDVRVVYGSADGWLRMVRSRGTGAGQESWAFMPRAVMDQQKGLRENAGGSKFAYGVDGAPVALVVDRGTGGGAPDGVLSGANSADKAYVFFGLRRGGSHYYALDVSKPDSPRLAWRIGPDGLFNSSGQVGTSADFAQLGLTFSTPAVGRMRFPSGSGTTEGYVLVFGGGYDGGRDAGNGRLGKDLQRGSDNRLGANDTKGNAIFIVNAETGELIWKAVKGGAPAWSGILRSYTQPLLEDSIPSEIAVLDTTGDGLLDRFYVGDAGGRVWRGDLPGADPNQWTLSAIASIGRHADTSVAADRRFFHAPDYVPVRGEGGNYDAVVFATGDREDPLNLATQNWLYALRDTDLTSGKTAAEVLFNESQLKHQADFADLGTRCGTGGVTCSTGADLSTGWRIKLKDSGEKAMSQPLTVGGTVLLTAFVPPGSDSSQCVPSEGSSKLYAVKLADSRPAVTEFSVDSDGDPRTERLRAAGLPGEVTSAGIGTALASTDLVATYTRKFYPLYWRERRGDEERPVPQK